MNTESSYRYLRRNKKGSMDRRGWKSAVVQNTDILSIPQNKGDRGNTVVKVLCYRGTAVAQWLRCCATRGPR